LHNPRISSSPEGQTKLGVGSERGDEVVVRRAERCSFADIHAALFPNGPPEAKSVEEMDEGMAEYMRKKHEGV
jgi:hypothetical protein